MRKEFKFVAESIKVGLARDVWGEVIIKKDYMSMKAGDVDEAAFQKMYFYNPLHRLVEEAGVLNLPLIIALGVNFPRIEQIIDRYLKRQGTPDFSVKVYFNDVISHDSFYHNQYYLIRMDSEEQCRRGVDEMIELYYSKMERLRKLMRSESCFDDPFF